MPQPEGGGGGGGVPYETIFELASNLDMDAREESK